MDWPKITIVTPSFNQADFLESTIKSILCQDYPNLEYIVVDGGSSDASLQIIKKYEHKLHRWFSEPDDGQYDAVNKGFEDSSGDIMAWLNSDDMYFPWTLKTVASIMSDLPQVEWLTTSNLRGWDWAGYMVNLRAVAGYSREAFLDGCYAPWGEKRLAAIGWLQQESMFWKRALWERAGGSVRADLRMASDFELWGRFFCHADLYTTASPLGGFRHHRAQKTRAFDEYIEEADVILNGFQQSAGWRVSRVGTLMRKARLNQLPIVGKLLTENYGYTGNRIIRESGDSPEGYWSSEQYKFM